LAIAASGGARVFAGRWTVTSQSNPAKTYRVNPHADECTCPDHAETGMRCKHIHAVFATMTVESYDDGTTQATRITYSQSWTSYNTAQVNEKDSFLKLLADLCATIPQPSQAKGRPRLPLSDAVFAMTYKVFSGFSSRRFMSDVRDAQARGFITSAPSFNSITGYMSKPELTPMLQELVTTAALPLRALEREFAVDASGFSVNRYGRWTDEKYGPAREKHRAEFVKAHVCVGTLANVITSMEVTDQRVGDSTAFPELVRSTAKDFDVAELSADKAYLSRANIALIEAVGAEPFVPFKSNSIPVLDNGSAWGRMYYKYMSDPETFAARYHRRSNVETTTSMLKRKFGSEVMSKTRAGQVNEVYCKAIAHNLVVVAQSAIEYGSPADFAVTA
jgi:transposase